MSDLESYKKHVTGFLEDTEAQTTRAQRRRDYINNDQWTAEEQATLRARKQMPTTNNRLAPKVDGLKGLLIQRRTDPKAFPRTQAHEAAAHAATDGLRFVADNTDFDTTKLDVADDYFVEGYGGVVVRINPKRNDAEITIDRVPWDRIYYDPHSRQNDYKDAQYMGILIWMDYDDAVREHGDKVEMTDTGDGGDVFEDRPRWVESNGSRKRIRIAEEFRLVDGQWTVATFTMGGFISEPRPVPYKDEDGEPMNPMELVACHIDRDNNRFSDVEYWMDAQDAINHGLSKYQHFMTTRQLKIKNGAVDDIDGLKREFKKPDGVLQFDGDDGDVEIVNTHDMAQAQMELVAFSSQHIDSVGFNAQLAGERQGNLSGKAINLLTNAGTNELASSFARLTQWENRVYRQVWARIRQFWTAEKWVRVTDEEHKLRWVGFNIPIPRQQQLEETINDESLNELIRKEAAQEFTQMMQAQDPRLQEPVETRNAVPELDMDIMLEQSLDTVNIQQEQFTVLAQMAANRPEIPFTALLRLSTLRDKDELIEKIEEGVANAGKRAQEEAQAEIQKAAQLAELEAAGEAKKIEAKAQADLLVGKQKTNSAQEIKAAEINAQKEIKAAEIAAEQEKALIANTSADHAANRQHELQAPEMRAKQEATQAMRELAQVNAEMVRSNKEDTQGLHALLEELQRPLVIERDEEGNATLLRSADMR